MTDLIVPSVAPRRRRWRWAVALVLCALLLAVIAAFITVRVVLAGDLPRRMIVREIQAVTGLHVEIGDARVTWGGRTVLRDVTIRVPLDTFSLIASPRITVDHAPLYSILYFGDPGLRKLSVSDATINLMEEDGQWQVVRAVALIRAAASSQPLGDVAIPAINLSGGTVIVSRPQQTPVSLPLTLTGQPLDGPVYGFDAKIGASHIVGRLSNDFAQSFEMTLVDVEPLLHLFTPDIPSPLRFEGSWKGTLDSDGLRGVLAVRNFRSGDDSAAGKLAISAREGSMVVEPRQLAIRSTRLPGGSLLVDRGRVHLTPDALSTNRVQLGMQNVTAELTADWKFAEKVGQLDASWIAADTGPWVVNSGRAQLAMSVPAIGPGEVTGTIESRGRIPAGSWRAVSRVSAAGSASESEVTVEFPTLTFTDVGGTIDLSTLRGQFALNGQEISLSSLSLPGANELKVAASVDVGTQQWSLRVDTPHLTLPRLEMPVLGIDIRAAGKGLSTAVTAFRATVHDVVVSASGDYDPTRPVPLRGWVQLDTEITGLPTANINSPLPHVAVTLDITGGLHPRALQVTGDISVWDLQFGEHQLGSMESSLSAFVGPDLVTFQADHLSFLAGHAAVSGSLDMSSLDLKAWLKLDAMNLATLSAFADPGLISLGTGSTDLCITIPGSDLSSLKAEGDWSIDNAVGDQWTVSEGSGQLAIAYPQARIYDIQLINGEASVTGELSFDVRQPGNLSADITTRRWPLSFAEGGLTMEIDSHARARVHLATRTALGDAKIETPVLIRGTPVGNLIGDFRLDGRTVHANTLRANLLGGSVTGSLRAPFDNWTALVGEFRVENLDLTGLEALVPATTGVRGSLSGTIKAAPALGPMPPAPLRIELDLTTAGGGIGSLPFGDCRFIAHVGPDRVVVSDGDLDLASGSLAFWSRLSFHDGAPFLHTSLRADRLDIDQLLHAVNPRSPNVVGTLSGQVALGGYIHEPHRAFGDAELRISEADLGRLPVFTQLYGLLRLDLNTPEPSGNGLLRVRLDGDSLVLQRMEYFNRGADIFGSARIHNIWAGAQSPITGAFAGAVRPLRDLGLPFSEQLDRLMAAAFKQAVSVRVSGELGEPVTETVPFAEVAEGFQRIMGAGAQ